MRHRDTTLALALLCLTVTPLAAQRYRPNAAAEARRDSIRAARQAWYEHRDSLAQWLAQRIDSGSGATVGLYYADLSSGQVVAINADARFHAASTMKVPVMVQVFRDVDAGRLSLSQRIPVTNSFRSLVGDSAYALSATDDSDSSLYDRVGQSVALEELVELMIQRSSNLATNILIQQVGAERVQQTMAELGVDSLRVLRGVEDGPAYRAGLNNTVTARALGQLFEAIADGRAASPVSCGRMLRVLLGQRFREGIPAGLPRRTKVAHKTGFITALYHDAGIVYQDDRPQFVLVVLTRGIPDPHASAALVADLARYAWNATIAPPR